MQFGKNVVSDNKIFKKGMNTVKDYTIGILGVASYATLDLFGRLISAFPAEKEWERPRIVIDNYCTMPSRVRAILYGEQKNEVVEKMSQAMQTLVSAGADRIVVDCNTAHFFLPNVLLEVPEAKDKVINIIDALGEREIVPRHIGSVGLIASEGVLDTRIYQQNYNKKGITVNSPGKEEYYKIRMYIEAVKQGEIDEDTMIDFMRFLDSMDDKYIVLGCTELPVLYDRMIANGYESSKIILDPLKCVISFLVDEYNNIPG